MWADQLGSLPRDLPPPPQYMLSLYNSVTDKKAPNPYEAKVIRSYTDKGLCLLYCPSYLCCYYFILMHIRLMQLKIHFEIYPESTRGSHFSFNISGLGEEESVLEAELHLYIMKNSGLQAQEVSLIRKIKLGWAHYVNLLIFFVRRSVFIKFWI